MTVVESGSNLSSFLEEEVVVVGIAASEVCTFPSDVEEQILIEVNLSGQ